MNKEYLWEEAQKNSAKLYNTDIVYKTLVDNYVKSNDDNRSQSINALATYTNELHKEYILDLVKSLNITNEDIRDMLYNNLIDIKTLKNIFKFKGIIGWGRQQIMNKYIEISKMFVFSILNANPTADGITDIFEINQGDTELLLKHLKAITNIMNKAIKELEREEVLEWINMKM